MAGGGIDELLDVLYGMVEDAWAVPMGKDKCVIEREKVLDLLDEIRGNLPGEIKAAREVVDKRNELIAAGRKEADSIKLQAEEAARQALSQNEITRLAKEKAGELVSTADAKSKELRRNASVYCDEILKQTEEQVTLALGEVKKLRAQLRSVSNADK